MRNGLVCKKIGMSAIFTENGERIGLTILKLEDCQVVQHRKNDSNGYNALVLGFKDMSLKKVTKPMKTMFSNAKIVPKTKLQEFRVSDDSFIEIGAELKVDHFTVGQFVDVSAVSMGKGFAGAMKRWNFRGLEASHGVSVSHRSHGSTGGRQDPGKVFKGKKMAGHMGCSKVTIQNLQVIDMDIEQNMIMVAGSVPGPKGGWVTLKDAVKKIAL